MEINDIWMNVRQRQHDVHGNMMLTVVNSRGEMLYEDHMLFKVTALDV